MSVPSGARVKIAVGSLVLATALALAPSLHAQTQDPSAPAQTEAPEQPSTPVTPDAGLPATVDPLDVSPPAGTPVNAAPDQTQQSGQAALDEIEKSITVSKDRADELRREIEEMSGDRTKQNAALIAAAQRVKMAEIEVASMEDKIGELIVKELEVRGRLDGADTEMANVLAALERVSRNPPPALLVDPNNALNSARSALLMSAIFPQLHAKAEAVSTDLKRLGEIKAEAIEEEKQLKANYAVLEEEQLRIATLIAARKKGIDQMTAQLAQEEQEALSLAARATDLKQLVASLQAKATGVAGAGHQPEAASSSTSSLTPEAIRLALANTSRTEPAFPFDAAKGYLAMPSTGTNAVEFGGSDGFGGISQGLSVLTRPDAQVVAPADGWVMYKGPYLNYGQIVILNPGNDYTILLAGLAATSVNIGQFVMMGEPVGTMGSHTIGRTVTTSAGGSRPTLYIELRKDNAPIDPTGWWAPNPTQSG